ncbi:hypothetical protein PYCCODRAFT_1475213 [Trametes coccinea BRFM310]|uniref:Uncharacterized protein n=1 Tax=Trametes coccinea (strain BRFM310) TaxID=1353009 RepID=A0A1Y2IZS5_TRAC3|nr:hypothetical protein PYCCODRAFT_1475213 [Trametes coccinea BRFM310]
MSDAKARAEARRKAILSRGGDRLARITSSGRGEGATYLHDDPPLAPLPNRPGLSDFVGETSDMPTPPAASTPASRNVSGSARSPFEAAGLGSGVPDPSVWSEEQQSQFMNALLGAAAHRPEQPHPRLPSSSSSATTSAPSVSTDVPPSQDDPMAVLMSALQQGGAGAPPGFQFPGAGMGMGMPAQPPKPKTLIQKLLPLIHVLAAWALLAYFVLWAEPQVYEKRPRLIGLPEGRWRRWADLSWKSPDDVWGVQQVPFFWAFTTLTLVLHSWRVFRNLDPVQPPMLLALALPSLPPPLPAIITNGMKYLQIGGVFFDDIAAVIVGLGVLVWVASWVSA